MRRATSSVSARKAAGCVLAIVASLVGVSCQLESVKANAKSSCEDFRGVIEQASRGRLTPAELEAALIEVTVESVNGSSAMNFAATQMVAATRAGDTDAFLGAVSDMTLACELTGN